MKKEKNFSDLDANYKSMTIGGRELRFMDGFSAPFRLEGYPFQNSNGQRARLPMATAQKCQCEGVVPMSMQAAGVVVRFRTNSPVVAIQVEFSEVYSGINRGGSAGFDLYVGSGSEIRFVGNRVVEVGAETLSALWDKFLPQNDEWFDCTLCFPYHCAVSGLLIGVKPDCEVTAPTAHRYARPVVFYGSSITNCGAAGRPGMVYPSVVSRLLDFELINMGFSGSCKGETVIADEIVKLNPAALVLEYDHNAPDADFLRKTHEPFFRYLRSLAPTLPVLMMSRCDFFPEADCIARREIVAKTWLNAVAAGDRNVEFLDGETLFAGPFRYDCTADGCHPNDLGAAVMAERIADRLKKILR